MRWMHILEGLFSRNEAGVAIALGVALLGAIALAVGGPVGTALGALLVLAAVALGAGALFHWLRATDAARRLPPPGRRIDVGSFRMHLLTEGPTGRGPGVIWVPGGHGQGLLLHHLHRRFAGQVRSILFDRAGSGWSDAGPFPRTVPREVEELATLLDRAEEGGRFVLVGHSFGGLLAANFAHRHPERAAGLVLLDPTPPWNVTFARDITFPPICSRLRRLGLQALFGLCWRRAVLDAEASELDISEELHDVADAIRLEYAFPKTYWSAASALWAACAQPLELVIGDGALGDLPLLLITAKGDREELRQAPEIRGLSPFAFENLWRGLEDASAAIARLSRRGEHVQAPEGTGHMFPYEAAEFVAEKTRALLAQVS